MQIFSTKLSNISETWNLDVEPSDTILGIKTKIIDKESPSLFLNTSKVRLFYPSFGDELADSSTLSDYNIQKNANVYALYSADVTVCGVASFNGKEVNGLYELRGWDPGGFYNNVSRKPIDL